MFGAKLLGVFPVFECDMIWKSDGVAGIAAYLLTFGTTGADGGNVFIGIEGGGGADDCRWSVAEILAGAVTFAFILCAVVVNHCPGQHVSTADAVW